MPRARQRAATAAILLLAALAFPGCNKLKSKQEVKRGNDFLKAAQYQPALAAYNRDPETGTLRPYALQVLTLRGGRIAQVDGFVTPRFFPAFGLPDVLEEPAGP